MSHSSIRLIKGTLRGNPAALAYIEEIEDLWAYAKRCGNVWRGIASAMGYEPNAHDSVKPTSPWLLERVAKYRALASAAGGRSPETNEDSAQPEGRQSGGGEASATPNRGSHNG